QFWQNDTGASWDVQQSRTANTLNEITGIVGGGWAQTAYDAAGNTVQMPHSTSPGTANTATFDAWNRLMALSSGATVLQQNAYDGDNRRVTKLASGTLRHYYFSSGCSSIEERLGAATTPDRQFVPGLRFINDVVLRDRGNERLYALQNANWDVTAICSSNGAVAERYINSPFGTPSFLTASFSILSASAYSWETLFSGYRWDSESALFEVCQHYSSTLLGNWLHAGQSSFRGSPPASDRGTMGTWLAHSMPLPETPARFAPPRRGSPQWIARCEGDCYQYCGKEYPRFWQYHLFIGCVVGCNAGCRDKSDDITCSYFNGWDPCYKDMLQCLCASINLIDMLPTLHPGQKAISLLDCACAGLSVVQL
ncbi:MAG: hypothetical protein ACREHD_13415, partial [Pirellulales bacterium]